MNQPEEFRLYLQQELVSRCRDNPAYSLRSFARNLKIEPSALSKILRGKRKISPQMFRHMADRMGLSPDEQKKYGGKGPKNESGEYQQLAFDLFTVIADWYHYALLELTQVKHFRPDPKWIASTLGISINEVHAAAERLQRLEMLTIKNGRWIDTSGAVTTVGTQVTAAAFRRLQKQVLEKAIQAMEDFAPEERDQSSMTMAIDTKKLPGAKKRIQKFRRELCRYLKTSSHRNAVYNLGISLYPVSKKISGGSHHV